MHLKLGSSAAIDLAWRKREDLIELANRLNMLNVINPEHKSLIHKNLLD